MKFLQCPGSCLFPVKEPSFDLWKVGQTQVSCPRCKRIFPRSEFGPPRSHLPGPHHEPLDRMPKPALSPGDHARRMVAITAPAARWGGAQKKDFVLARLCALTRQNDPTLVDKLCAQVARSSLTANFPTAVLPNLLRERKFKNFWQIPREAGYDHKKYSYERESTELALHPLKPMHPSHLGPHLQGKPGLPDFEYSAPDERPISAALNIGCFLGGASAVYGTSYVVLKNEVKGRCTFTAGDSLEHHWKRGLFFASVGTEHELINVLHDMGDGALAYVAQLALGGALPAVPMTGVQYVEAQIFGGIDLTTDVLALVVDEDQLDCWARGAGVLPDFLTDAEPAERPMIVETLKKRTELFCAEFRIHLQLIRSGWDGRGFSPQKVRERVRFRWQH